MEKAFIKTELRDLLSRLLKYIKSLDTDLNLEYIKTFENNSTEHILELILKYIKDSDPNRIESIQKLQQYIKSPDYNNYKFIETLIQYLDSQNTAHMKKLRQYSTVLTSDNRFLIGQKEQWDSKNGEISINLRRIIKTYFPIQVGIIAYYIVIIFLESDRDTLIQVASKLHIDSVFVENIPTDQSIIDDDCIF